MAASDAEIAAWYYQGKPCEFGHTLRYKTTRACAECTRTRNKQARAVQRASAGLKKVPVVAVPAKVSFAEALPKCCPTPEQYKLWQTNTGIPKPENDFCTDCTQGYKHTMTLAGRCENPAIQFRHDSEGFIEGFLPGRPSRLKSIKL